MMHDVIGQAHELVYENARFYMKYLFSVEEMCLSLNAAKNCKQRMHQSSYSTGLQIRGLS